MTVVTSVGGDAITLAGSAGGKVTSFAGAEYTIAVNSAVPPKAMQPALVAGLLTVLTSACVGALIAV